MIKKGFLTRDIVITGLIFTSIIALFVLMITSLATNYNQTSLVNDNVLDKYDKLNTLTEDIDISRVQVQSDEGISFIGVADTIFSATFTVIRMVFATLDMYGTISANFVSDFTFLDAGVIKILFILALTIITTILIFLWVSSISRGPL